MANMPQKIHYELTLDRLIHGVARQGPPPPPDCHEIHASNSLNWKINLFLTPTFTFLKLCVERLPQKSLRPVAVRYDCEHRSSTLKRLEQFPARFHGIHPARAAKCYPFHHINTSLPRFDLAYHIEWPLKPSGQLLLRKLSVNAHFAHGINGLLLTRRVKIFSHGESLT